MHHSLYSDLFAEEITPTIVLNPSNSHLAGVDCDQAQVGVILPYEEEKNEHISHLSYDLLIC